MAAPDPLPAARSLTVDEARRRSADLRVPSTRVELDLDRGAESFGSVTTLTVEAVRETETFLDVRPRALHAISLDGVQLDPGLLSESRYPLRLAAGRHELRVEAEMAYSRDGEGLHRTVDPSDGRTYLYLMTFLDAAPRCFACFDQPDLKSRFRFDVRTPADWTVLGNTRAVRTGPGSWELPESLPISTYHVTLVAGPYSSLTREHDGILLGLHAKQSLARELAADADELFEVTAQSFDALHDRFGVRYPFGDYHQAFVPEFNAGAMECPGCVLFRDGLVFRSAVTDHERSRRVNTIVHEMAHQWFGNLVTPVWWDDLWLNESFATYIGYRVAGEATRFGEGWVEFAYVTKRWGLVADQLPSSHPVASNGAADAHTALNDFDGISYAKGAAVLKQLAAHLGDDVFFAGVRDHLAAHPYGNATLADLLDSWERAGASDLHTWADAWLRSTGADLLRVEGDELTRIPSPGGGTGRPHRLRVARVATADGATTSAEVVVTSDRTRLPWAGGDGHVLLLDTADETWGKLRPDPDTERRLPELLPRIDDPVTRGALWLAVRDAFDDAELDPRQVLDLLCAAVPEETSDVAVRTLLDWAEVSLLGRVLGDTPAGAAAADRLATSAAERVRTAPAGSGLQLAAARGLARLSPDTALIGGWLDGPAPAGLAVDAELRWHLLTQLCRRGVAGDDEIERELRRDPSAEGRVHATRCRAALPDPAAKAASWHTLTADPEATNYTLYAIGEGFWWPEQQALTAAYVPRFFAEMPATTRIRTGWVVAESVGEAFPRYAVDTATLERADAVAADPEVDGMVRREVADASDPVRRALRIRERWTTA